jgi:hypothetical protein
MLCFQISDDEGKLFLQGHHLKTPPFGLKPPLVFYFVFCVIIALLEENKLCSQTHHTKKALLITVNSQKVTFGKIISKHLYYDRLQSTKYRPWLAQ